jgi:hypothetical protein
MPYSKRQIVEVYFDFEGETKPHPAIILSVEDVYHTEEFYLCAMISSSNRSDEFSFPLRDEDVSKPLKKGSCVRTHLIAPIPEDQINKATPINHIKTESFQRLIDHIDEVVFGLEYIVED